MANRYITPDFEHDAFMRQLNKPVSVKPEQTTFTVSNFGMEIRRGDRWIKAAYDIAHDSVMLRYSDGYTEPADCQDWSQSHEAYLTNKLSAWVSGSRPDQVEAREAQEKSAALYKSRQNRRFFRRSGLSNH